MQTLVIDSAAAAPSTIFGDGLPEPGDVGFELPGDDDAGAGGPGGGPVDHPPAARGRSRLKAAAVSAALAFALVAYLGVWAAIVAAILAAGRALLHLMGASG